MDYNLINNNFKKHHMKKLCNLGDVSPSGRMTFLSIGLVVFIANCLVGFENVSWLHWAPPIILPLAALTGVCPFKIGWEKLGFKK
jgi:hypothetical protein